WQTAGQDETRRLLMLQAAAFLPLFRDAMSGRGAVSDVRLESLDPAGPSGAPASVEEIFAEAGHDHLAAARKAASYLRAGDEPAAETLIHAARRLVFLKGRDPHDYKFSSAVLEDYYHVSPSRRAPYLAAATFLLKSSA